MVQSIGISLYNIGTAENEIGSKYSQITAMKHTVSMESDVHNSLSIIANSLHIPHTGLPI